ncbi:hypothetical protein B0O99DRAFT_588930 [Bisporella sp. PMI_857]|nr:hypothetical protein B0O99DRAFT_588930 [Bisporella sp. PMI_857]
MTMIPYQPNFAILWGLLHLATKLIYLMVSLSSKETWIDFGNKIDEIQSRLDILEKCAACFAEHGESHEMSRAILAVFVSLVNFWVEAVNWNREQKHGFHFSKLNKKFEAAIAKVKEAVENVTKLLDIALKKKGGQDLLQNIELAQENIKFPLFVLPRAASQLFYGREEAINALESILSLDPDSGKLNSILLYGMGGVGKTSIALQYAYQKPSPYDAVFWVRSETSESLHKSFTEFAVSLKLPGVRPEGQDELNLLYFRNWLRTQAARGVKGRKWLMIFDNCENIDMINDAQVLSTSGAVIITSRHSSACLSDTHKYHVKPFGSDDGLSLLKRFLPEKVLTLKEEECLKNLLKKIDGLPIGIRVLAASINSRTCSLLEYPEFFLKHSRKLLTNVDLPEDYDKPNRSAKGHILDQVWLVSFGSLRIGAKPLLGMMSFLAPDVILPSLFKLDAIQINLNGSESSIISICEDEFELHVAMEELIKAALIDKNKATDNDTLVLSIHRLVQEAFLYNCGDNDRQEYFDASVQIVYEAFPHQINGRPFFNEWIKCKAAIQHGVSLVERFLEFQGKRSLKSLRPSPVFGELLKNCAWYKLEVGEHNSSLAILEVARKACMDKSSELYAHLLNTEGCCYFEKNDLQKCREAWEPALKIREAAAKSGSADAMEEYSVQVNNFGNLETAEGHIDEAIKSFSKAEKMRLAMGPTGLTSLGLTHMTSGRAYFEKKDFSEAAKRYDKAEAIFVEKFGARGHFMAHLAYARGNMALEKLEYLTARKFYDHAVGILQEEQSTKFHILVSACYYKIAVLQLKDGLLSSAQKSLAQGRQIAELHGAIGDTARIIRKEAHIFTLKGPEASKEKYESYRQLADLMRARCPGQASGLSYVEDSDIAWDRLVCGYWR